MVECQIKPIKATLEKIKKSGLKTKQHKEQLKN